MSQPIKRLTRADDMSDAISEVRANGVVVIENLFDTAVMDLLFDQLNPFLEGQKPGGGDFFGHRKRSVNGIFGKGREFSEHLLLEENLLEIADGILLPDIPMSAAVQQRKESENSIQNSMDDMLRQIDPSLGPNCHHYRINASVCMQVCEGGDNQPLHRDEWRYRPYMRRDPKGPELSLAFMVALSEFTQDNGATRFVPGSNQWEEGRIPQDSEIVQAAMPKGSVAVWLGSVYHGLGVNRTQDPRNGLIFSYVVDHLSQEENQFTTIPRDFVERLPKRAQQIIGYHSSAGVNFIEGLEDGHALGTQPE